MVADCVLLCPFRMFFRISNIIYIIFEGEAIIYGHSGIKR